MPDTTATTAINPTDDGTPVPQPVDTGSLTPQTDDDGFVTETPITEDTPQEDIDAAVQEALNLPKATPAPVAPTETPEVPEDPENPETPKTPDAETPVAPVVEDDTSKPVTKGYVQPDPEEAAAATKAAQELAGQTVDTSDLYVDIVDGTGETVRISLDSGVPDDITFKNDKQLFDVMTALQEMNGLKNERELELQTKQAQAEAEAANANQQSQVLQQWDSEIADLIETGDIPTPASTPDSPDFNKDPATVRVASVMDFIVAENTTRLEAGKPPITSFGTALRMMDARDNKAKAVAATKAQNTEAKQVGGIVGGTSAAATGNQNVYKSGAYRNIWEVPVD